MTVTARWLELRWLLACGRLALCGVLTSVTIPVGAAVFQTDVAQTPLPQPVGADELNLGEVFGYSSGMESYRDPANGDLLLTPIRYGEYYSPPDFSQFVDGDVLTLAGLFKWRGEQIDPVADAKLGPGHFSLGCGFQVELELVLRGGGCDAALGWYNFNAGSRPTPGDIHALRFGAAGCSGLG